MPLVKVEQPKGKLVPVKKPSAGDEMARINTELHDAAVTGIVKSGAGVLQTGQNILDLAHKYSPNRVVDEFLAQRIPGFVMPEQGRFLGNEAANARAYAETIKPPSSVANEVMEGAAQAPALISQVHLMGGGIRALGAQGFLERYNEGVPEAVKAAALNMIMGTVAKFTSKIKPGAKSVSKITPALTGAVRAAVGGGTGAATSIAQGDEPDRVVAQALLGAAGSGADKGKNLIEEAKSGLFKLKKPELEVKALKNIRKRKAEKLKGETDTLLDEEGARQEQLDTVEKVALEHTKGRAKVRETALDQESAVLKQQKEAALAEAKVGLQAGLDDLSQRTNMVVKNKAVSLQPKMREMFREKGKQYDVHYEAAAAKIDASGEMTRGDIYAVLQEAKQESIADADINFGRPFESINRLIEKYALEGTDPKTGEKVLHDPGERIPFKEFRKDLKKVENQVDFKGRPKPDDIPYHILKSKSGDLIAKLDPSFSELQAHYSEVIKAMNRATKSFSVYKGKFETEAAEGTLKKVAEGKTSGGLDRTLDFLERGTDEFPGGLGDEEFAALKRTPEDKRTLEQKHDEAVEKASSNYMRRMNEVDREIVQISRELSERTEKIRGKSEAVRQQIAQNYKKRIDALEREFNDSVVTSNPGKKKYALDWRIKQAEIRANRFKALRNAVTGITAAAAFLGVGATRAAAGRAANVIRDTAR